MTKSVALAVAAGFVQKARDAAIDINNGYHRILISPADIEAITKLWDIVSKEGA
jgi:hypothetical protein